RRVLFRSNAMNTPGSPCSTAPRTRNSIANRVLPQPALPHTSVGRPFGSPPPVLSSKQTIPVATFGSVPDGLGCLGLVRAFFEALFRVVIVSLMSRRLGSLTVGSPDAYTVHSWKHPSRKPSRTDRKLAPQRGFCFKLQIAITPSRSPPNGGPPPA